MSEENTTSVQSVEFLSPDHIDYVLNRGPSEIHALFRYMEDQANAPAPANKGLMILTIAAVMGMEIVKALTDEERTRISEYFGFDLSQTITH